MPRKKATVTGKPDSAMERNKSTTTKRTASASKSSPRGIAKTSSKHKLEDPDTAEVSSKPTKKHKTNQKGIQFERKDSSQPKGFPAPRGRPHVQPLVSLNQAPTQRLSIYVFGGNSGGELGLRATRGSDNITRPHLNPNLAPDTVGVVHLATGGMHCAALTHDNKILTWGVNDLGALGRDTTWDGGLVDIKNGDDNSDSDSESGLSPKESTPTEVDMTEIPRGTVFTQLSASDNATFALTDKGLVYGWGTIRVCSYTLLLIAYDSLLISLREMMVFLASRPLNRFNHAQLYYHR